MRAPVCYFYRPFAWYCATNPQRPFRSHRATFVHVAHGRDEDREEPPQREWEHPFVSHVNSRMLLVCAKCISFAYVCLSAMRGTVTAQRGGRAYSGYIQSPYGLPGYLLCEIDESDCNYVSIKVRGQTRWHL